MKQENKIKAQLKYRLLSTEIGGVLGIAIIITTCQHLATEIDGENICRKCGTVLGYSEVESISDWKSHDVGFFTNHGIYWLILKVSKNLHLPTYATQTIIQTTSKLAKKNITKKQSILFATVYACRVHKVPRLLGDIFYELENSSRWSVQRSERALLKLLNKINKKIDDQNFVIYPPNKDYYLQAYLAKVQKIITKETDVKYFELVRVRASRHLSYINADPSTAAKTAILQSTSSIIRSKIKPILSQ